MTEKSTFCSTLDQGRGKQKKEVKSSSLANTFDHDCSYATLGVHYPMVLNQCNCLCPLVSVIQVTEVTAMI